MFILCSVKLEKKSNFVDKSQEFFLNFEQWLSKFDTKLINRGEHKPQPPLKDCDDTHDPPIEPPDYYYPTTPTEFRTVVNGHLVKSHIYVELIMTDIIQ